MKKTFPIKLLTWLILLSTFLTVLSGCSESERRGAAEPTAPSQNDSESSVDTQSSTDVPAAPSTLRVNDDLLADLGCTYGELAEKYGSVISAVGIDGGILFTFKHRFGIHYYFGSGMYDGSDLILPGDDSRCRSITANAKTIFRDFSGKKSVSELERELGVSATVGESKDIDGKFCAFEYADYIIAVCLDANNEVNEESFGQIFFTELWPEYSHVKEPSTSPSQVSINESLLSDIGCTYGELVEKYGEGTNISGFEWELWADFDNRTYHFRSSDPYGSAYSGGGGFEAVPKDDAICDSIGANAGALFNNLTTPFSLSDVEDLGISASIASSIEASFAGEIEGTYCHFEYGNCVIDITLDGNEFTRDSETHIVQKESSDTGYEAILKEYEEACKEDAFDTDIFRSRYPNVNEGILYYYHTADAGGIYYCRKDLNNDGVDELFIGNGSDGHISIIDLYLLDGNKAVKAIENDTLGDRSRLTLYTDGTLYENGSSSAGSGTARIYRVNRSGTALEKVYAYEYTYTEAGGWYQNEHETISAEEFFSLLDGLTEETSFDWKFLA